MEETLRPLLPFFVAVIALMLVVLYVPQLSTWLPSLLGLM